MISQQFRSTAFRLPVIAFLAFFAISLLTRISLCIGARHELNWDLSLAQSFLVGSGFDFLSAVFASIPWCIAAAVLPSSFLTSRTGRVSLFSGMVLYMGILVFISTSEWFFWDEFGARFNFIAVDYLIWTQEVWGNINESYPMVPIFAGIITIAALIVAGLAKTGAFRWALANGATWKDRFAWPLITLTSAVLIVLFVSQSMLPAFANQYHGELAKNGPWSFFAAFKQMELDYDKWYARLPRKEMLWRTKKLLATPDAPLASDTLDDLHRNITGRGPEKKLNVILVCMESMSGDFLGHFGNKRGLTPNLDQLANESLCFENLYATGTRTVRGMEALTLNLPPTPGQAIIYRPEGTYLTTTFTPYLDRGYDCAFLYGGDGRFDFMNRYFSTAGARIVDSNAWKKDDITMKTSWGACDEDLFRKTMAEADANHAAGKPFHFFCMTTSNHRPYDFPNGRIDLPSHSGGRKAAVKYADWAIGYLIRESKKHAWFKDTLFVIVADHCASSAGKMEIDVSKYHIPAMVYNPELIAPRKIEKLCSQVDVMPTVFGLMNWNYRTLGYGHDMLAPSSESTPGRAFVSNYQKIALLEDSSIAILKPNKKISTYKCDRASGNLSAIDPESTQELVEKTQTFYQSACWLFGSGKLKKQQADEPALTGR